MKLEQRNKEMWAIEENGAEWPYMTQAEYEASLNRPQPDPQQEKLDLALDILAEILITKEGGV